jgi:predicted DNA-binding protein YlxM (UPF0122 family)
MQLLLMANKQSREITKALRLWRLGKYTIREIARKTGVTERAIYLAIARQRSAEAA